MNDNPTPSAPEDQPAATPQPQLPPQPQPQSPAPQVTPGLRVTDITRTESRPVGPIAPPLAPSPAPVPPVNVNPVQATSVPPVAPTPQPQPASEVPASVIQLQEDAERSADFADTLKTIFWGFINWVAAPLLIVFILHNFVFRLNI